MPFRSTQIQVMYKHPTKREKETAESNPPPHPYPRQDEKHCLEADPLRKDALVHLRGVAFKGRLSGQGLEPLGTERELPGSSGLETGGQKCQGKGAGSV